MSFLLLSAGAGLLLTRLTPMQGAIYLALAASAVGTLIEPLVGVGIGLFLGLLRSYLRAEVPAVPAQIGQVFVLLALGSWLLRALYKRQLSVRLSPVFLMLSFFILAALLSLWSPVDLVQYGIPEWAKWVQVWLVFLLVDERLTMRGVFRLVAVLVMIGLFQAGVGVWQFGIRGEGPDHFAIPSLGEGFYRAYGTFEQPNPYAGYIGLVLALTLGTVLGSGFEWRREQARSVRWGLRGLGGSIASLLLGAALVMSWSRGAWMGFAAASVAMAAVLPRRAWVGLLCMALVLIAGAFLFTSGLLPASITARLSGFWEYVHFRDVRGVGINDANYSIVERFAHWQAALEMFRCRFWTGVGIGNYEPAYPAFALINWPNALGHAHNFYLTLAAETGLIGLLAYVALWSVVLWQTGWVVHHAEGYLRGIAIGLFGAWVHLSVHHLLDNLYVNNVHIYIAVLLGLLSSMRRFVRSGGSDGCLERELRPNPQWVESDDHFSAPSLASQP